LNIQFTESAWKQYQDILYSTPELIKKINQLIQSIDREGPLKGLGQAEKLRYEKFYSRRITHEHRLVYLFDANVLIVYSCLGHYE
jgi:toxin YoeB